MPELPEVETVCRTLDPLLSGKTFASFELQWSRTLANIKPDDLNAAINGQVVAGVWRRAKLILIELESGAVITVHLRMTGELLFVPAGTHESDELTRYLRAAFLFTDSSELLFLDVRKFGRISWYTPQTRDTIEHAYGIEPLEADFTVCWVQENLAQRKRQMKRLLLDQTFIAGLGNIYVDETLFLAGIHPLMRSDTVAHEQAGRLHQAIVETLTSAIEHKGTTLRNYRSGTGEAGENRPRLLVYGSKPGTPCVRCGTGLQRLVVGQRGSVFCPTCQPLVMSGDMPNR